ncbi:MAG TPA: hypothetical protein VGI97_12115, partial [Gemmatimonadaceae bacterium]
MHRTLSPVVIAALALATAAAGAQQPSATAVANSSGNLPFGATTSAPVSKWTPPPSAGRQLTLDDLLTWKSIRSPALSNDGKWFAYAIAPNEGDGEVVVRGTSAGAKEMRFLIGDPGGAAAGGGRGGAGGVASPSFSGNNKWAAFLEYASGAAGRGGRSGRGARGGGGATGGAAAPAAPAGPKLAVLDLVSGTKREFENVRSFRFAGDKSDWIAIQHNAPASGGGTSGAGGAGGAGGAARAAGTTLELVNLAGGTPIPIADVSEFAFDDSGDWIAYAVSAGGEAGGSVQVRQLSTSIARPLDVSNGQYRRLVWGDSSDALAAIRVVTDTAGGDEDATVVAWTHASQATARTIEISAKSAGITGGLVVSSDRSPEWSDKGAEIYFGLREPRPPRPRNAGPPFVAPNPGGVAPGGGAGGQVAAAPQTDADVPSLILWHWKDTRPQPEQQVQEAQDRAFSYLAGYNVASSKVTRLADDSMRTVAVGPKDAWAIGTDITPYQREQGIKGFAYRDIY